MPSHASWPSRKSAPPPTTASRSIAAYRNQRGRQNNGPTAPPMAGMPFACAMARLVSPTIERSTGTIRKSLGRDGAGVVPRIIFAQRGRGAVDGKIASSRPTNSAGSAYSLHETAKAAQSASRNVFTTLSRSSAVAGPVMPSPMARLTSVDGNRGARSTVASATLFTWMPNSIRRSAGIAAYQSAQARASMRSASTAVARAETLSVLIEHSSVRIPGRSFHQAGSSPGTARCLGADDILGHYKDAIQAEHDVAGAVDDVDAARLDDRDALRE